MNKIKSIFLVALMGSGIFALICAGLLFLRLARTADQLKETAKNVDGTLASLKNTVTEAQGAISDSRKQLEASSEVIGKVLLHVDRATGEAAIASRQQRVYWETISKETATVLDSANQTIQGLNTTQKSIASDFHASSEHLNEALAGIPPVLDQTRQTMSTANTAVKSLDTVVSDPSIKASLQNIDTTTANVAASSEDIKVAIHRWTRPASVLKSLFVNLLGIGAHVRTFF